MSLVYYKRCSEMLFDLRRDVYVYVYITIFVLFLLISCKNNYAETILACVDVDRFLAVINDIKIKQKSMLFWNILHTYVHQGLGCCIK